MQESLNTVHLIGSVLLGRYRIVRELAKGGMGVVYLARSEGAVGFVKPVVVKLVLPEHAADESFVGMFAREARILAELSHPSVVDVLEFGEERGAYVLVLEYVHGHHLGQWTRYLALKGRKAPPSILIQTVIDVLEALDHAHHQKHPDGTPMQIVHRDVSPSNILLDEDGRGRLLDFGVARMRGGANDYKTQVETFKGKLFYTAPEIFSGGEASPQSDLYAAGVVLHESLLGRNVFRAENQAATLYQVMHHVPAALEPLVEGLTAGFDAVLAKALSKDPAKRYSTAREFASALRKLQRKQENDIRLQLAALLKDDFGQELADLLEIESLAERDEAWRRLSVRPIARGSAETGTSSALGPSLSTPLPALDTTVASPPAARRDAQAVAPGLQGAPPPVRPDPLSATPISTPMPRSASLPPSAASKARVMQGAARPRLRALVVALVVMACIAIGAIVVATQVAAPAKVTNVRVVAEDNAAPAPVAGVSQPTEPTAAPSEPSTPEPTPLTQPVPTRRAALGSARSSAAPDMRELTRAFRKQQPKIEACVTQHAVALEGQPRIELEFDLDAAGKLTHVQLVPASVAATPLGQCIERIARATAFPAQGQSVSFAIPVTASRGQK